MEYAIIAGIFLLVGLLIFALVKLAQRGERNAVAAKNADRRAEVHKAYGRKKRTKSASEARENARRRRDRWRNLRRR